VSFGQIEGGAQPLYMVCMNNITSCFFQAIKEEKASTAGEAVPMVRVDPQARRILVAVPLPCLHIKFHLIISSN